MTDPNRKAIWARAEDAPTDGRYVLACFRGQFGWVRFIAHAGVAGLFAPDYAKPTHWMDLPEPPNEQR